MGHQVTATSCKGLLFSAPLVGYKKIIYSVLIYNAYQVHSAWHKHMIWVSAKKSRLLRTYVIRWEVMFLLTDICLTQLHLFLFSWWVQIHFIFCCCIREHCIDFSRLLKAATFSFLNLQEHAVLCCQVKYLQTICQKIYSREFLDFQLAFCKKGERLQFILFLHAMPLERKWIWMDLSFSVYLSAYDVYSHIFVLSL